MAALTDHKTRLTSDQERMRGPRHMDVTASTQVFDGAIVYADASTGAAVLTGDTGANRIVGIAESGFNNTVVTPAAVTTTRPLLVERGHFERFALAGVTAANVGDPVYADNDADITLTAGTNVFLGRIHEIISGTDIYVEIDPDQPAT